MYYVTIQIMFQIPEFAARKERNLHCDVVHITTVCVSGLVLRLFLGAFRLVKALWKCYDIRLESLNYSIF